MMIIIFSTLVKTTVVNNYEYIYNTQCYQEALWNDFMVSIQKNDRLEYVDETINQLARDFMKCDNANRRKYYKDELRDIMNFISNITSTPIKNPLANFILNGTHINRISFNNYSEWISEDTSTHE